MARQLEVSIGQYSSKGCKKINQDFHGAYMPKEPLLSTKGIAIALADGISSSDVSQIASEAAVTSFLDDYYCTSEAWSVKKSVQQVLLATNAWLYAQTRNSQYRLDRDRGYVCTFSAMVFKASTAYLFHAGDARIYRVQGSALEQLTDDHRLWISQEESYLSRAMGVNPHLELDFQTLTLACADIFLLATDGVYEFISAAEITDCIANNPDNLDAAAQTIIEQALAQGSDDNLTVQIIRVEQIPAINVSQVFQQLSELSFPPPLEARMEFDGYRIVREIKVTARSHVHLAMDIESGAQVVLKLPSIDLRDDPAYLERFLLEEWIARRIDSPHVMKPCQLTRNRSFIYLATEYIDGQTLSQWMIDNPKPTMAVVRNIVEQIARGLQAFHRLEMVHQDVRPENILIDTSGTVKIIDFGATRVAGITEMESPLEHDRLLGTVQYSAPEYFLGEKGSQCSDIFSLGVICYQMLTGKLPYGAKVARTRTPAEQRKLRYVPIQNDERQLPAWLNDTLKKALQPFPAKRYGELSEFIFDLRQPNRAFLNKSKPPLIDRNPLLFWQVISLVFFVISAVLLIKGDFS